MKKKIKKAKKGKAFEEEEKAEGEYSRKSKTAHMKPNGARGRAQVKKLGRTYKTGGFSKIAKSAAKEYGSKAAGQRVAGAVFQHMAAMHSAKRISKKAVAKYHKTRGR